MSPVTAMCAWWASSPAARIVAGLLVVLVGGAAVMILGRLPTGFIPNEDQGVLFADIKLPTGRHCRAPRRCWTRSRRSLPPRPGWPMS